MERYRQQLEEDKKNENYDLPEQDGVSDVNIQMTDEEMDEYKKTLDKLRNDENDMRVQYRKFHEMYKSVPESELKTEVINPIVAVRRAYCPECGKEIVSKHPIMFDGFTGQKIVRYDCECGAKFNLEYAYPRVMFLDENMNEMKVWTE